MTAMLSAEDLPATDRSKALKLTMCATERKIFGCPITPPQREDCFGGLGLVGRVASELTGPACVRQGPAILRFMDVICQDCEGGLWLQSENVRFVQRRNVRSGGVDEPHKVDCNPMTILASRQVGHGKPEQAG